MLGGLKPLPDKRSRVKEFEVRLIAELMRNSRASDRELAKTLKVSQPTVSRTRERLERDGIIREYTMIPDFKRLGYQIMAVTFLGKQETMKKEEREELRRAAVELEKRTPYASLIVVNGEGLRKGRMLLNFYKDYTSYTRGMDVVRNLPHVEADEAETFLINLEDETNFRVLSMKEVARHIESSCT